MMFLQVSLELGHSIGILLNTNFSNQKYEKVVISSKFER